MEKLLENSTNGFRFIPITQNTYDKIRAYARIAGKKEVYGFLLSPLEINDGVVYDAILAKNQNVSTASAGIDGDAARKAKDEIRNLGYKPIGFWHSHGNFNTFHSPTDDGNMEHLLLALASYNEERQRAEQRNHYRVERAEGKVVCVTDGIEIKLSLERNDTSFESKQYGEDYLSLAADPSLDVLAVLTADSRFLIKDGGNTFVAKCPKIIEIGKAEDHTLKITGAAYSVVVNRHGDCYAEIGIANWCNCCEEEKVKINKNVSLDIRKTGNDIDFDENSLVRDLEERVIDFRK